MKLFTNKEVSKKIIIAILLVMSFNFISPTVSRAVTIGDALFKPVSELLCMISDLVIKGLQSYFMGYEEIYYSAYETKNTESKVYNIAYSPGIIFSGEVRALDVNFINPKGDYQHNITNNSSMEEIKNLGQAYAVANNDTSVTQSNINAATNGLLKYAVDNYGFDKSKAEVINTNDKEGKQFLDIFALKSDGWPELYRWQHNGEVYLLLIEYQPITGGANSPTMNYDSPAGYVGAVVGEWISSLFRDGNTQSGTNIYAKVYKEITTVTKGEVRTSSAGQLQKTVATWYKALRAIALVGLLSVLIYVGIRILISSTGQEKAKYKKMIGDWLVAICILFILQYIMVFTLEITQKITDVLSINIIGQNGQDKLMSMLRQEIEGANAFIEIFPQLLMYLVLVIYTVMFTLQYLKRLVYMAFFTMIAPLIALTYPLDKIKDGQAQAFSTWLREYIFNALLQPMHLLLYYIFVSSAIDLATSNPLYAVVAIGFLLPAEKFFRKMFGFDKASSANQLGAAAGGALIMNAINKMGHKSGKHAAGGSASSGGSSSSSVRTASSNGVTVGAEDGGVTPTSGGTSGDFGATRTANQFGPTMGRALSAPKGSGMAAIGRRFINANTAKKVGRMARRGLVGAAGAATLGTVGLAAGLATGDYGKALQYGATGVGAGYLGANYLGDKALEGEKSLRETFKEGQIGQNEYNNLKADKEFYNSQEFRNMVNNNQLLTGTTGLGRTAAMRNVVQVYRDSGITDTGKIATAMKSGLSPQEGAYAIKLAEMIGRSGWNNPSTRKDFETRYKSKIPGGNGNKIWNSIEDLL